MKRLDLEYDNLLATLSTLSSDHDRTSDVLALGVALFRFVTTRHNSVIPHYLRDALSRGTDVPVVLRARALVALSWMTAMNASQERSHQLASDLSEQALALSEQLNDDDFKVQALNVRAFTLIDVGRTDPALECANAALELARRINSPRRIAEALGAVVYAFKSPPETREQILEALAIFRQLSDANWVSSMLMFRSLSLGETQDDVREARALNKEAIEIAEEIGSTFHHLIQWSNAGAFSFFLGEYDVAMQQSQRALRLSRRNGSPVEIDYWTIFTLACCATQRGDFVLGAQLTGVHDGFEERAIEPLGGYWSPLEIKAREENRTALREALGDDEFERLLAVGKGLSADRRYELALGRATLVE